MSDSVSHDEIVPYILGRLPAGRIREIESLAQRDEDLDTTIVLMRSLLGSPSPEAVPIRPTAPRRMPYRHLKFIAAVLLMAGLGYGARAAFARLAAENGQLKGEVRSIRPAKEIIDSSSALPIPPQYSVVARTKNAWIEGGLKSIAFPPVLFIIPPATKVGTVDVTIQNVTFPCYFKWTVAGETKVVEIPLKGANLTLPSGDVRISCEAIHVQGWGQPYTTVHNGAMLGSGLGTTLLRLNPGDVLRFHLEQPFAPWNAVMIRIKGEWVMVTLERPWANYDVDKYRRGQWREVDASREELPNTALFWAREKTGGLAAELARYFVDNRFDKSHQGKFRGRMHTGLTVPGDRDGVSPIFREITAEELTPHLVEAFELLRKQRPPIGPTIQEEIDAAEALIRDGLLTPRR